MKRSFGKEVEQGNNSDCFMVGGNHITLSQRLVLVVATEAKNESGSF